MISQRTTIDELTKMILSDSKANDIYRIAFSFFDDDEQTQYLLKVLGVSLFTNKHEQLNILTGSGRNGKSLIMNWFRVF